MDIKELRDREAIQDVHLRCAQAVDQADMALLRTVFTKDARLRYADGSFSTQGIDNICAHLAQNARYENTQHMIGNETFDIKSNSASTESNGLCFLNYHRDGEPVQHVLMIRYEDALVEQQGRWKIHERIVHVNWRLEQPAPLDAPIKRSPSR